MKISDLIEYVKELRPGIPYSDTVFLRWVNDLEAELCTEVYLLSVEDFAEHTSTDESVTVDATHTKIFWSYLLAMISLANGEMARYNDDFAIFKSFMTEYKSWYAMTYHPADKKAIVSGYYLTAYALAVKYGFEGTEEEWVNAVEYSRVEAETAAESAKSAQEAAEKAKTAAEAAKAEVVTNTEAAQTAASTATQKASDAVASAKVAADSAADSARKATEAADSAQAAAESATSASESAENASTAKAAAEAAQQAAETAKAAAQEAQSLAESAKISAQTAATNAKTSETNAKAAQTAAENAKNLAETAKKAAEGAQSAAEAAMNAAAQSAQNAQESADNAENSADESEAWACGTISGVAVHPTHPAYQNNAKWYKDQAREIVGGDYATKTQAQGYVGTHDSDSAAHSELFSEKLDKTGDSSNVTASFTQAKTRANIGTGEKLSVIFGKIKKFFADLGSLAFMSTVAKTDLESEVQESLDKADTAVQTETDPTVPNWAKQPTKPSYDYSEINDKPTSFPPSVHKHSADDISGIDKLGGTKTARFVIGTSTAGWTSVDCDYLCDGIDDQVEINNAIQALPDTGGEIVILDGTYNITAKIDVNKNNVSIRGNGNATILKRMYDSDAYGGVVTLTNVSGCHIKKLQIDGNKVNYTYASNCGIRLHTSDNNTITGNICTNNGYYGIYLFSDSNNNIVANNTCSDAHHGIYLNKSNNNVIANNTCSNNNLSTPGSANHSGVTLYTSIANTIIANICNNNTVGIFLKFSSNRCSIINNTCNANDEYGININNTDDCSVIGNTCNSNNKTGTVLTTRSVNVIGNIYNNNKSGIFLNSNSYGTVVGNTCMRGTGLDTDYTADQYTIRVVGTTSHYNFISSNNCMGKAVVIDGGTSNTEVNNKYE